MRILLVNQFFWPDTSATSQLLTDVARALADSGHEVTVLCTERGGYALKDQDERPMVRVRHVRALAFSRGKLGRILSYLSFYWGAAWVGLTGPKQQVVLTLTTPPLLPLLGTLIKLLRGAQHFIWEMDLYPDVAVDLGYFKAGGILDLLVGGIADYSRRHANGILALGDCMAERLERRSRRLDESWSNKTWIAHNWADGKTFLAEQSFTTSGPLTVLYSGNIGLAHDFETILWSIKGLGENSRFQFLFRGGGARRQEIAAFLNEWNLKTISLGESVARSALAESLSQCDIGLVTQREACCGSVVPSKVYGLLAAGKPILFIGPENSTVALITDRFHCGWVVSPGDVEGLIALLLHLESQRDEVLGAGILARKAFTEHFDLPLGVGRIQAVLEGRASPSTDACAPRGNFSLTQPSEAVKSVLHASSN